MAKGEEPKERKTDGTTFVKNTSDEFLRFWLEVMRPRHGLTSREMDYAAALLKIREKIAEKTTDQSMIDKVLFEEETKELIRKEAKVNPPHAKAILYSMKRKGFIQGKRVNPSYIPRWQKGVPFRWTFVFLNEDK